MPAMTGFPPSSKGRNEEGSEVAGSSQGTGLSPGTSQRYQVAVDPESDAPASTADPIGGVPNPVLTQAESHNLETGDGQALPSLLRSSKESSGRRFLDTSSANEREKVETSQQAAAKTSVGHVCHVESDRFAFAAKANADVTAAALREEPPPSTPMEETMYNSYSRPEPPSGSTLQGAEMSEGPRDDSSKGVAGKLLRFVPAWVRVIKLLWPIRILAFILIPRDQSDLVRRTWSSLLNRVKGDFAGRRFS